MGQPRQREAYDWFTVELANLRTAFRWAADHDDLDAAATIAVYAAFLGFWVEQYEPVGWAEELIEPARAVDHRRLAQLYAVASQCYFAGRIEDAVAYAEAAQLAIDSGRFDHVRYELQTSLSGAYIVTGQPEHWVQLCRNMIARIPTHTHTRAQLVLALTLAAADDEAMAASEGLLAAADAADNPHVASMALFAHGIARREADPAAAYDVHRRGLAIAQASGNRQDESCLAVSLSRLAASHGDPMDTLDFLTLAIRNRYDSGSLPHLHPPLAILAAAFFDRLGHYEAAATISGFAANPLTRATYPEITTAIAHLREVLGDQTYESLAGKGATMTTAAMATFAYDQIDQARTELERPS